MTDPNNITPDEMILERPFTSSRRRWKTLGVVIFVAIVIYVVWWFLLAETVREQINVWIDNNRMDGRDIQMARLDVDGFLGWLDIQAEDVQIVDTAAGWRLRVPGITATMAPWKIDEIDGSFTGPMNLAVAKGPALNTYIIETSSNTWAVDRDQGVRVRLDLEGVAVTSNDDKGVLKVANLKAFLIRGSVPIYGGLNLKVRDITLPAQAQSPFGSNVKNIEAHLEWIGGAPPGNLTAPELTQWANRGGAVEVRSLRIIHGTLGLDGDGTMALDGRLQPVGAFSARVTGYDSALNQLIQAGLVRSSDGNIAKMILGALGKVPAGGGPKQIDVPISVQDQRLSVGPIPLMRVPAILW